MIRILMVLVGMGLLLAPSVRAQEMKSLGDYLAQPPESQEASYSLVRCSGLYLAATQYLGADRMTKEEFDNLVNSVWVMVFWASQIREATGMSAEVALEGVNRDMENVAAAYRARMDRNYAASGTALMDDPLITADFPICKALAEESVQALN